MEINTTNYPIDRLGGWQMFNENNETNATEAQIIEFINQSKGKSAIEQEKMLDAFCNKHKAVTIKP